MGASSPTDDGDCYFWGSITPNSDLGDIDSYAYYKYDESKDGSGLSHLLEYGSLEPVSTQMPSSIEDRDKTGLTKYCSNDYYGYNGFADNLTILESMDDAATANYGGRIPTKEEWQELCDNTTSRWIAMDGLVGRCFTGPNGNTLFLPASYDAGNDSLQAELNGCYLSSSLFIDNPYSAWTLQFDSKEVGVREGKGSRYFPEWSVRAVRPAH